MAEKLPFQKPVFISGEYGYHTFRIPAVIVSKEGTILAFCEGRRTSGSDHGDLDIVLRRSCDNGKTWTNPIIVYGEAGNITIGNPCPVVDQSTGTIWLPFCRDNNDVLITKSNDDGITWSEPIDITKDVKKSDWGWYATGPGVGIQIKYGPHKGRMVIPCDHREKMDDKWFMFSHVFYSDDAGKTWQLGGSVAIHTDECQLVELTDGRLLINMRNYWERTGGEAKKGDMRALSWSDDGGETWSELEFDEQLIEPICQASFIRYDKKLLLFSNPADKSNRINMTVRISCDEGESWPLSKSLYAGPSAYSCLTVLPDMSIGCLYECGEKSAYQTITFANFDLDWFSDKKE
ncbi:exo-alpha-sialidase [Candidatus Poribacteria bacterium]|nr:exo-alpha-sialidase [Candidatus Poribacteria bacterium]